MQISLTTEPLPHQHAAVAKIGPSRVGGLFMDMGTGKSLTAIMLSEKRQANIDKIYWGCPCSLRQTIVDQILEHTTATLDDIHVLTGFSTDQQIAKADWIIFGIESVGQSDAVTLKLARHVDYRSMMIIDESTYIKGAKAKRTDRLTCIASVCRYRLVMTGTPLTQGLVDLFAQMKFLSTEILGYRSFWSFEQAHLRYRYEKRVLPNYKTIEVRTNHIIGTVGVDEVVRNVEPYIYQVRKEDCLKLPPKAFEDCKFDMSPAQREAYEIVKEELILNRSVDDFFGSSSSIAMFRLFSTLQKVTAGIRGDIPHHRLDTLIDWIEGVPADEPIVIWTKYRACADAITRSLHQHFGEGVSTIYDGRYADKFRQQNLRQWRAGDHRFLLATQDSGGHGLTLVECAYTAFYADGFKYSNRVQAEDRFHRIGQTRSPLMASMICRNSIDERIAENHWNKGRTLHEFRQGLAGETRKNAKDRLMVFVG